MGKVSITYNYNVKNRLLCLENEKYPYQIKIVNTFLILLEVTLLKYVRIYILSSYYLRFYPYFRFQCR